MLEVADAGKVPFCPVAVLAAGRDTLRQSSVGEPLERRIYPAETETLLYDNEVRECIRHRGFAPINGHPTVRLGGVVHL